MSDWVTDRPPRAGEIKDYETTYVTIQKEALGKVSKFVTQMSGFIIRAYFGGEWRYTETILAWYPVPQPWDEQREAEEAAKVIAAMMHDEKARELIHSEHGDAASHS